MKRFFERLYGSPAALKRNLTSTLILGIVSVFAGIALEFFARGAGLILIILGLLGILMYVISRKRRPDLFVEQASP